MDTQSIGRLVRRGVTSLFASLNDGYWPAQKGNDMSERNISTHVAHSFLSAGWFAYSEVSFPGQPDARLDVLCLSERSNSLVAIESKRLESAVKAHELAKDLKRLKRFRLVEDNAWFVPPKRSRFGVLLAFTWSPEIKAWWVGVGHKAPPLRTTGKGWRLLGKQLDRSKAVCRFKRLPEYGETEGKYRDLFALYSIVKTR